MPEPRISLLAGDSGQTFASTGLVVMRESKAFFQRILSNPPQPEERDFEAILAWRHEIVHFLQSISTSYLYAHSVATIRYAFNVLDNFQEILDLQTKRTKFEEITEALSNREFDLSVRDLLEGVAVIEAYKMSDPNPTLTRFLYHRDKYFTGDSKSCYRRTFDYLSGQLDNLSAYYLLTPLSFLSLQDATPPKSFKTIVEDLLPKISLDLLLHASIKQMYSYLGMNIRDQLFCKLDNLPSEKRHPILYESAKYALGLLGKSTFTNMVSRPSVIESSGIDINAVEALLPPMVVFSSTPCTKLEGMRFGLSKRNNDFEAVIIHTTGLIGAAERLTVFRDSSALYQFCPHKAECPHYTSSLCFNYFTPPSLELGYRNCGFIRFFKSRTKMLPDEAWSRLKAK